MRTLYSDPPQKRIHSADQLSDRWSAIIPPQLVGIMERCKTTSFLSTIEGSISLWIAFGRVEHLAGAL